MLFCFSNKQESSSSDTKTTTTNVQALTKTNPGGDLPTGSLLQQDLDDDLDSTVATFKPCYPSITMNMEDYG